MIAGHIFTEILEMLQIRSVYVARVVFSITDELFYIIFLSVREFVEYAHILQWIIMIYKQWRINIRILYTCEHT